MAAGSQGSLELWWQNSVLMLETAVAGTKPSELEVYFSSKQLWEQVLHDGILANCLGGSLFLKVAEAPEKNPLATD